MPVRRGGPALPQCRGMDSLRRQPSCGGGGWRRSCPPAVAGEDVLGKSVLIFVSLLHGSCFSARPCLYPRAQFLTSTAPLLLPAAVWVLLAGVTIGGKWPEPGISPQPSVGGWLSGRALSFLGGERVGWLL